MLGSLKSHEEGEQDPDPHNHHHRSHPHHPNPSSHALLSLSVHARQLLISCAELIHRGDIPTARRTASLLSAAASPHGDSTDRFAHQFARALSHRLASPSPSVPSDDTSSEALIQSSYLSLNQVTPFLRFAHLTANQAILDALHGCRRIHILDLDTSHGVLWPHLLQAIADHSDAEGPLSIRITSTSTDLDVLCQTGDRLQTFANSLGLQFQFHPLLLPIASTSPSSSSISTSIPSTATAVDGTSGRSSSTNISNISSSSFQLHPSETLAVNCALFLHKLLKDSRYEDNGSRELRAFLQAVKAINPTVVTVVEREASHNSPNFLQRFIEAPDYYTVVFESMEAMLPPKKPEAASDGVGVARVGDRGSSR